MSALADFHRAGTIDAREGEYIISKPTNWSDAQWSAYQHGLTDHSEIWGLVIEEPGTGSQCVPHFSKGR